jgi:asparagine synthase (glutamine-hydrolysing)
MNPRVPQGGFFVAINSKDSLEDLEHRLKKEGAQTLLYDGDGIVLAVWKEFPGQGLWMERDTAVAYDLDLTNEVEIKKLIGWRVEDNRDPGELLLKLYEQKGTGFIDYLRGPFGFALWDGNKKRLLVATDAFGIRPVVFSRKETGFEAASRIRHIILTNSFHGELDPEAVYHYLFYEAICSPVSIYKNIRKLEPGKALIFETDELKEYRHYDILYNSDESFSEDYWIDAIPKMIRKAVASYATLTPIEKTGCFLSGGTDSSSVAGYSAELTGKRIKTFSIGFDEPGYDELNYAAIASSYFNTEQHHYYVTPEDVLSVMETLPEIYDEPFGNSSVIPAFYCAKLARRAGVNVLLAGDGGDEIFGGNERYVTNLVFEKYYELPSVIRTRLLEPLIGYLPSSGFINKFKRYIRRANIPNPDRFFSYNLLAENENNTIFREEFLSKIDTNCFLKLARGHYRRVDPAHVTNRLLYLDMKFTITDNDLRKVTQMTEAAGIRSRFPFLDRDLVDFAATIPADLKVKPGKNRYIFKRAMDGFLPRAIIQKTKHGFGLPIAPWFKTHKGLSEYLNETLFAIDARITEWVRPQFLSKMKMSFESDTTPFYGSNFWIFMMLEMWLRKNGM